jgi:hypothetical protein
MRDSPDSRRAGVAARLRARREEIEQATSNSALGIGEPPDPVVPEYLEGLRAAAAAAVEYAIAAVQGDEEQAVEVPASLVSQARLAARTGIGLDVVLRRYFGGYTLFGEFLLQEAAAGDPPLEGAELRRTLGALATHFDRLVTRVSDEHRRARESLALALDRGRAERIEKLLAGEPVDTSELGYEMVGFHLAAIVSGSQAPEALYELARMLDARLLRLDRGDGVVWGWLGRREPLASADAKARMDPMQVPGLRAAFGEPAAGRDGWRLSHRQACAAWPIALRGGSACVRYADVALPAAVLSDGLLATSLRNLYLRPLSAGRGGGGTLIETLRAYLAAGRNASSAAAALGVTRQTVVNRLRSSEVRLGRCLDECSADLDVALQLDDLSPD